MKIKNLLSKGIMMLSVVLASKSYSQVPVANFTVTPTPFCTGGVYQINDQSTNTPSAWSYTIRAGLGGPGGQSTVVTVQNPTITFNTPGVYTITLVSSNSSGSSTSVSHTITVLPGPNANITPQNVNTCIGGSPVTITVTTGGGPGGGGAVTYSWSNGATTGSISVSPSVTTVYSCIVTGTNGCSTTRMASVTITTPTVTIVCVPANICPGTVSTMTATGTGPAPHSYTWSNGLNTAAISTSVPGVFTASVTNGLGCTGFTTYSLGTSTTLSLTAGSTPSILCAGNTGTLTVTGASNYTWSTGSTATNPTINPTSNTTYTVIGQIGSCTGTSVVNLSVSITPTVTILSGPTSLCAGGVAILTASGASSYTWLPSNTVASSLTVSPTTSTSYTVRGQNPGCPARNATVALQVFPSPVITIAASSTAACAGEALALSAGGANTYSWSNGSNGAVILVYPTVTSTYVVIGSNSSNCIGTASVVLNISDCTGIAEAGAEKTNFIMYPNPAQTSVTFIASANVNLEVLNITGQRVKVLSLEQNTERALGVDDLAPGVYFVRSVGAAKVLAQKLVIE